MTSDRLEDDRVPLALSRCPHQAFARSCPHTRVRVAHTAPRNRSWSVLGADLHRILVWQGSSLPKVETRFVGTHHATSLSSPASWRPVSRLTGTFQGLAISPVVCIRHGLRPNGMSTSCKVGRATKLPPFAHSICTLRDAPIGLDHLAADGPKAA